MIQMTNLN